MIYSRQADLGEIYNEVLAVGYWYTLFNGYNDMISDVDGAEYNGIYPNVSLHLEKSVSNISKAGPWYKHVEVDADNDKKRSQ